MLPLILNTNFHKAGIENWLRVEPAAWESPILGTCSRTNNGTSLKILYTHPQSLGTTLETFHFPETVRVFSNSTPITQSSINLQKNKNQPPLAFLSTNTPHALDYANPLAKRLRGSSQTPGITQGNFGLSTLPQTQETKR